MASFAASAVGRGRCRIYNMKKTSRETQPPRARSRFHHFRPTPLALALFCATPAVSQAALNLPPFQIDPALMQPATAPSRPATTSPAAQPQAAVPMPGPAPAIPTVPAASASAPAPAPAPALPASPIPLAPTLIQPISPRLAAPISAPDKAEPQPAAAEKETAAAPLGLRQSKALSIDPPAGTTSTPIFIQGLRLQGHKDIETEAIGDAELRQWGQIVTADRLVYNKPKDELFAQGNVHIEQKGDITEGPELRLQMTTKEGYMQQPVFQLNQQTPPGRGDAKMLRFEGENRYSMEDARYNTCEAGSDDWFIHASKLEIDRTTQVGTAHHAYIDFMNVPILYTPWMNFSLNKNRKSGFLTPSYGSTNTSGGEFSLPYYWNIAPNMDATITPRLMSKRGLQLKNEFRYLAPAYTGIANLEILPNDQITSERRDFMSLVHQQNFGGGWAGALNLERASDDNYFRDLSTQVSVTSQVNLLRDGVLSYAGSYAGAGFAFSARSQSFQTLQDPLAPVGIPYRRTQFLLNGAKPVKLGTGLYGQGLNLALNSELVDFTHPTALNGKRFTLYPSISLPITPIYGYVIPKIGLHSTRYTFEDNNPTLIQDVTRTLPIFSVDSGLFFERDFSLFGNAYQQTLEPRLYYVRTPFRDQSQLPQFDTGDFGFGIPQIFTENRFSGGDRISDANQVTLGVTTRFLEENGIERLRATLAQRYYLTLPRVTLGGPPPDRKFSDVLVAVGGRMTRALSLDSLLQYDPDLKKAVNFSMTSRYLPEPGKALNVSYRYTPSVLKQIDSSIQWPLTGGWNGLVRWNYSVLDDRNLESLAGVEYNAGCWAFRAVVHSFATATSERSNSLFFQLELNGVSSIGSNPLEVLRRNIYGYTKTTDINNETIFPEYR